MHVHVCVCVCVAPPCMTARVSATVKSSMLHLPGRCFQKSLNVDPCQSRHFSPLPSSAREQRWCATAVDFVLFLDEEAHSD